jgi:uncharacterized SAM-binding protein YcdF (DUF218 family)
MDTGFFLAAKLAGALLQPDTWIVFALASVVLALLRQRRRLAQWLASALLAFVLVMSVFPLGDLLLQPLEQTYPAQPPLKDVDGIIILGGSEEARASAYWEQVQLNEAGERYTSALALARRFPEARLVFTGGSGALRDFAGAEALEADVAVRFFTGLGIAPQRLLVEGRSRNTAENARLSLALASPAPGETWVLVTSAFHMPRAVHSFEAAGWTGVVPWPVDYRSAAFSDGMGWELSRNLRVLGMALRERAGQLAYGLRDR